MLSILITRNCTQSFTLSSTIQKCRQNVFNFTKDIVGQQRKNININRFNKFRTKNTNNSTKKSSNFNLLTGGAAGLSTSILLNYRNLFALCNVGPVASDQLVLRNNPQLIKQQTHFDWFKFWQYLRPHIWTFLAAICAALAVAYYNIKIPELLGIFVNGLSKYAKIGQKFDSAIFIHDMKRPAFKLFGFYMMQSVFTFVYIFLLSQIGEQMAAKLRQDLFKQIIIQDLEFFDASRTGELVNRLTSDVQDFKSSFKQCVSQGLRSIAQLIGGSISLMLISPQMAGVALVSVPLAVGIMSLLGGSLRALSRKAQAQNERATLVCEEAISNIRTVRSSACEYTEIENFERETNESAELSQQLGTGVAIFQALTNFFLNGMVLTTLALGGHLMATDAITPGQLMSFLVASQGVQRSLAQGSVLLGTLIRGMTSGSRVFEYLAIKPKIDLLTGIEIPKQQLNGEIIFENVTFAYPSRPNEVVLKNFNLILKPGQTVALVGASGSGKSTVAGLLERFYEPSEGQIRIDGYELNTISPYWLRSQAIGFIEQQPILLSTTIMENIRYGRTDATNNEIFEVAKQSNAHEFIMSLNANYGTNVGERGAQLSGGQRQRIAIARALLKKPTILILDEATSALDASSEATVQKALDAVVEDRTTLVIAHRLSTIKNADLIVVLDQGRIVESGTHEELMSRMGYYFKLVQQQEKRKDDEISDRAHG